MLVLGIETSCDETAAAIVDRDREGQPRILSNIIHSQAGEHAKYGGVVPEIAARSHLEKLDGTILAALRQAGLGFEQLDAIAVTAGPGLVGGLIVGTMTARAIAAVLDVPLVAVNHLEGHALTPRLTDDLPFPYLLALMSGGHTQIIVVRGIGDYVRWGSTIDDAIGEAFDKCAKLLGLGYPGGPAVQQAAKTGDPNRFKLPRPLAASKDMLFSFSGLKTAVRAEAQSNGFNKADIADLCAGFQAAVSDVLAIKLGTAMTRFDAENSSASRPVLVVAGGVAANSVIRSKLEKLAKSRDWHWYAPPTALCTDNGAVIAWAGLERLEAGLTGDGDPVIRARWPLDENADRLVGHGRRGAKV